MTIFLSVQLVARVTRPVLGPWSCLPGLLAKLVGFYVILIDAHSKFPNPTPKFVIATDSTALSTCRCVKWEGRSHLKESGEAAMETISSCGPNEAPRNPPSHSRCATRQVLELLLPMTMQKGFFRLGRKPAKVNGVHHRLGTTNTIRAALLFSLFLVLIIKKCSDTNTCQAHRAFRNNRKISTWSRSDGRRRSFYKSL